MRVLGYFQNPRVDAAIVDACSARQQGRERDGSTG